MKRTISSLTLIIVAAAMLALATNAANRHTTAAMVSPDVGQAVISIEMISSAGTLTQENAVTSPDIGTTNRFINANTAAMNVTVTESMTLAPDVGSMGFSNSTMSLTMTPNYAKEATTRAVGKIVATSINNSTNSSALNTDAATIARDVGRTLNSNNTIIVATVDASPDIGSINYSIAS